MNAVGTYSFNAVDTTLHAATGYSNLVISSNTVPITCTLKGGSLPSIPLTNVVNSLNSTTLVACSLSSDNNQVTTGKLFWNGGQVASGNYLAYSSNWNNQLNPIVVNSLATANYTANSTSALGVNALLYKIKAVTPTGATGYETQTQAYSYDLNFTKAATSAVVNSFLNGNFLNSNTVASIASTDQVLSISSTIPLIPANGIIYTFTASGNILFTGAFSSYGTQTMGVFNTFTQNELWNYVPATVAQTRNILIGGNDNIFMNITQPIPLWIALVNYSKSQVGTSNAFYSTLVSYKYYRQITGFIPGAYGYVASTTNTPVAVGVNSFLQLYYNGQNIWRNTTNATAFNVYTANLTTCTTLYPTQVYKFTFYNATSGMQYTNNVQVNGNFRVNNGNTIAGNTAGLPLTNNGFTYWTCEQPSWASFNVNATLNYSTNKVITYNSNTVNSTISNYYFLNLPTSNVLQQINLYLTYITNPSVYNFEVQNLSTGQFIPSIVEIEQYNINSGNVVVVNEVKTPAGAGAIANLQTGTKYQFFVYSMTGAFLANTTVQTAYCAAGTICNYIIPIGSSVVTGQQSFQNNMKYSCTLTALAGNVERTQCSILSVNGTSISGNLQVISRGLVFDNVTCSQSAVSLSMTLTCTSTNTNNTTYHYVLSASAGQFGMIQLTYGDFGTTGVATLGATGWIILIMLVTVSSLGFVKVPALGMMGALLAVLVAFFIGGIYLTAGTIGALIVFFGFSIWAMRRGQQ